MYVNVTGALGVGFELNNTNSMNTCDDGIEEAFINVGKILSGKLDETRNPVLWDIASHGGVTLFGSFPAEYKALTW